MKSILLLCLLTAGALSAASPDSFQVKLEAYVAGFAATPVDQPWNFTSANAPGVVMLTKCSDSVVLFGHRPINFGRSNEAAGDLGYGQSGENPIVSQADLVANVLPQIVATFSARYWVALTPISSRVRPWEVDSSWVGFNINFITGYLLVLTPRADIQPFPSLRRT